MKRLLVFALGLLPSLAWSAQQPIHLKSMPEGNVLGLQLNEYILSWTAAGQTGYQVLMASDERILAANVGDIWDSGRREGEFSARILARGAALKDGATVWWKVRVWGAKEAVSAWSSAAKIEVPGGKKEAVDKEATTRKKAARNRIALLGGTLISRMDKYGFFETAVSVRWPRHDISFRNLGWPADDVFGTARSEFGSAHNTRSWQPPKGESGFGFSKLKRQLAEAQPSTIVVGYGGEAAFADTEEKMKRFEAGYRALITELKATGAHLVLLTPPLQARHGKVLPDPSAANKRLERAAKFIILLAKSIEAPVVSLHLNNSFGDGVDIDVNSHFENGVHLNERGYRRFARSLATKLGVYFPMADFMGSGRPPMLGAGLREHRESTKRGERYDFTRDQLPPPVESTQLLPDIFKERIWVNGVEVERDTLGQIRSGADVEQVEKLRQVILEKNKMHRYKLNPINKAYIFLFRRHEMGHLAYELEDFEEYVQGREQAIAKLRVPRTHRYEVVKKQEWKAPRNYPDHEVPKNIPPPNVQEELKAFTVAEGMEVNLFAANPMIYNPINLNWDRHGRAWVSTSSTYPHIKPGNIPNDRIVILEDTDQDGVADTHKVFAEGLTVPHSVMPVEGGAYVCSTTELIFLADADGDDVSESRRVVYSGFGNADVHHMIHGLRWAPWGDLFFTQSIYINSFVETPHGPRRLNGSGVWRFRPETEYLDIFSRGRVNPWGHALDDFGRSFGTDGAGGQGPHDLFPGSAFGTAVGAPRVMRGLVPGKPKNTAAEFMSGRHVPTHWRGSILGNDFRANRTVRYELKEKGSGFTGAEVETVLHSSHRSFRPVDIKMGPEGAIYVVDWYNPIIDHGEVDFHHPLRDKSHGRIWRLTAKGRPQVERPRIATASIEELFGHLTKPEQYARTQANRELVRREVSSEAIEKWVGSLDPAGSDYDHHLLEVLWLLTARNLPVPASLEKVYVSEDPRIRGAAARNAGRTTSGMSRLAAAVEDEHPRVRLEAVSALRALGTSEAASVALRALDFEVDANLDFALEMAVRDTRDQWLPAMQAGKKVFDGDPGRLSFALKKVNDPRAIAALVEVIQKGELKGEDRANAVTTVAALGSSDQVRSVLAQAKKSPELLEAIAVGARSNAEIPAEKAEVLGHLSSQSAKVRMAAAELAGRWKIEEATEVLAKGVSSAASTDERLAMTTALARLGGTRTLTDLWLSQSSPAVRAAAIAAQAGLRPDGAAGPAVTILGKVEDPADARIVFEGFLGRQQGPGLLAKALVGKKLPQAIAEEGSRVARASGRDVPALIAALNKAGGLKPIAQSLTPAERRSLLADAKAKGSAERGQQIYHRAAMACATCHLINGKGGKLGPDLSTVGSYMTPESLLESVLNPSTDIKQGYETVMVTRKDQTLVSGLLQRKTDSGVLVRDPAGKVVSIPGKDIAKVDTSPVSLMPPGLTSSLTREEMVDLMNFLTTLGKK